MAIPSIPTLTTAVADVAAALNTTNLDGSRLNTALLGLIAAGGGGGGGGGSATEATLAALLTELQSGAVFTRLGVKTTASVMPAGGSGVTGWLSSMEDTLKASGRARALGVVRPAGIPTVQDNLLVPSGGNWLDLWAIPGAANTQFKDFEFQISFGPATTTGAIIFEGVPTASPLGGNALQLFGRNSTGTDSNLVQIIATANTIQRVRVNNPSNCRFVRVRNTAVFNGPVEIQEVILFPATNPDSVDFIREVHRVGNINPVPGATSIVKAEDTPANSGDVGVAIFGVRQDRALVGTNAPSDYGNVSINRYGHPLVVAGETQFTCYRSTTTLSTTGVNFFYMRGSASRRIRIRRVWIGFGNNTTANTGGVLFQVNRVSAGFGVTGGVPAIVNRLDSTLPLTALVTPGDYGSGGTISGTETNVELAVVSANYREAGGQVAGTPNSPAFDFGEMGFVLANPGEGFRLFTNEAFTGECYVTVEWQEEPNI